MYLTIFLKTILREIFCIGETNQPQIGLPIIAPIVKILPKKRKRQD